MVHFEPKQVYVYGHLEPSPMQIRHEDYCLLWNAGGWVMPAIMERIGAERSEQLQQRAPAGAKTTFAS
jgi:NADPH:quinone reductase